MNRDTPILRSKAGWLMAVPAGREILFGNRFELLHGYRVVLQFSDSVSLNSLSVEAAKTVAQELRQFGSANADALFHADQIEREADLCERLNAGWLAIGKPPDGFATVVSGNA